MLRNPLFKLLFYQLTSISFSVGTLEVAIHVKRINQCFTYGNFNVNVFKLFRQQLSLTTKEVQVVLVNEIEGAHVPMLLVRSSMRAKAFDWSAQVLCRALS